MGVVCNEERKEDKRKKIITSREIDITSNDNKETDDSIQNLKNDIKNGEEEEKNIISKINDKFNIINRISSNDNFIYKKITFIFQEENEPSLTININKNTYMNTIYQKIKLKKDNLPRQKDLTFFYKAINISPLFTCNLQISKFNTIKHYVIGINLFIAKRFKPLFDPNSKQFLIFRVLLKILENNAILELNKVVPSLRFVYSFPNFPAQNSSCSVS